MLELYPSLYLSICCKNRIIRYTIVIVQVVAEEVHTDPKLSSTATVTVSITDANDNSPTFSNPTYTAVVLETAPPGTPVITITAKDRDSGR